MKALLAALALTLAAVPAAAEAPAASPRPPRAAPEAAPGPAPLRPRGRPVLQSDDTGALEEAIALARLRPNPRPPSEQELGEAALGEAIPFASLNSSIRPWLRPGAVAEQAMAKRRLRRKGAVCGDIDLQGEEAGRVPGRIQGCGIKKAVRLRSVAGVELSQQALIDCPTAAALKKWVTRSVQPAFRSDPLVGLRVAAHYTCRSRNNIPGGRISEHGRGKAIDISAFMLQSGRVLTVLGDWAGDTPLKKIQKAACGTFGTVLGPGSDGYHRDHFHLDTAARRGRAYCR